MIAGHGILKEGIQFIAKAVYCQRTAGKMPPGVTGRFGSAKRKVNCGVFPVFETAPPACRGRINRIEDRRFRVLESSGLRFRLDGSGV